MTNLGQRKKNQKKTKNPEKTLKAKVFSDAMLSLLFFFC